MRVAPNREVSALAGTQIATDHAVRRDRVEPVGRVLAVSVRATRGKLEASRPELLTEPLTAKEIRLYASNDHMSNFFDCVRSRKPPICEAEIGHRSVSVCHLGVIALRLGRKLNWDPEKESFVGDKEADGYLTREMRKPWTYEAG